MDGMENEPQGSYLSNTPYSEEKGTLTPAPMTPEQREEFRLAWIKMHQGPGVRYHRGWPTNWFLCLLKRLTFPRR